MNVIGIDPSLTGTGIAYHNHTTTVKTKPTAGDLTSRNTRLNTILAALDNAVLGIKPWDFEGNTDLVVLETPALTKANAGTTMLNGLFWRIVADLHTLEIPVTEATPTTLKKFATGKGNATKPDMRMALYQRAGIDLKDDNQVDAWWLAELGRHLLGIGTLELPRTHTVALEKVANPFVAAA